MYMKIVKKRNYPSAWASAPLWVIPTFNYILQKAIGIQHNNLEWLWWVVIPTIFTFWFLLNFKIVKTWKKT